MTENCASRTNEYKLFETWDAVEKNPSAYLRVAFEREADFVIKNRNIWKAVLVAIADAVKTLDFSTKLDKFKSNHGKTREWMATDSKKLKRVQLFIEGGGRGDRASVSEDLFNEYTWWRAWQYHVSDKRGFRGDPWQNCV